jgi:hypothetical protein
VPPFFMGVIEPIVTFIATAEKDKASM